MYWLLFLGLLGVGGWIASPGLTGRSPVRTTIGLVVVVATLLLVVLLSLWGELLWFEAIGYENRFWRMLGAVAGSTLLFSVLGAGGARLLCASLLPRESRWIRRWTVWLSALTAGAIGLASWERLLLFLFGVETGVVDPMLGRDTAV